MEVYLHVSAFVTNAGRTLLHLMFLCTTTKRTLRPHHLAKYAFDKVVMSSSKDQTL